MPNLFSQITVTTVSVNLTSRLFSDMLYSTRIDQNPMT